MNKRIAKKILNPDSFHWQWYCRGGLWSHAPIHPGLYFKACKTLHIQSYYDREWLNNIQKWRKEAEK